MSFPPAVYQRLAAGSLSAQTASTIEAAATPGHSLATTRGASRPRRLATGRGADASRMLLSITGGSPRPFEIGLVLPVDSSATARRLAPGRDSRALLRVQLGVHRRRIHESLRPSMIPQGWAEVVADGGRGLLRECRAEARHVGGSVPRSHLQPYPTRMAVETIGRDQWGAGSASSGSDRDGCVSAHALRGGPRHFTGPVRRLLSMLLRRAGLRARSMPCEAWRHPLVRGPCGGDDHDRREAAERMLCSFPRRQIPGVAWLRRGAKRILAELGRRVVAACVEVDALSCSPSKSAGIVIGADGGQRQSDARHAIRGSARRS